MESLSDQILRKNGSIRGTYLNSLFSLSDERSTEINEINSKVLPIRQTMKQQTVNDNHSRLNLQKNISTTNSIVADNSANKSSDQSLQTIILDSPLYLSNNLFSKEIFNACKIGDLIRLKKLINSNNVNIRDNNKSTVSLLNLLVLLFFSMYNNYFSF